MAQLESVPRSSLPVVAHFGCGHLGIGAVLPFLIDRYGPTHRIVVFQRRSAKWENVPKEKDIVLPLRTTAGDRMPFRTIIADECTEPFEKVIESGFTNGERRLLILVPDLFRCRELMEKLWNNDQPDILVSCSLGSGQTELIQMLTVFPGWTKALVFENTPVDEWSTIDHVKGKKWHHVLVDRICWSLDEFSPTKQRYFVLCHCEKDAKFSWPDEAGIPDARPNANPESTIPGELIEFGSWATESFKQEESNWRRLRKRALVNAPHAIAALLCCRLLADRKMELEKQYLAPFQQMLRLVRPDWREAMDHYLRLRAIEVAWKNPINPHHEQERLHLDYLSSYEMAKKAEERFFATSDRLDRLISRDKIDKELTKFEEHILNPITFYERKRKILKQNWIYGRPNHNDIISLRGFLTETFLRATRWLTSARH